jgi:hypothetical protein
MSETCNLNYIPTRDLIYALYDRLDDHLFAPERQYDPFLDMVEREEKLNLWQISRLVWEDYKDYYYE